MKSAALIPILMMLLSQAWADQMYRVNEQLKLKVFGAHDSDPFVEMTILKGECFPLRFENEGVLTLNFGEGVFILPKSVCSIVSQKEESEAITNYKKNLTDNEVIVQDLLNRKLLGQSARRNRKQLEILWHYSVTPYLNYTRIIKQIQAEEISRPDGLAQIEKEFSEAIIKVTAAKAAITGDYDLGLASTQLTSLTAIRDIVRDMSNFNRLQKTGTRKAIGKAAISGATGNFGGALETLGHQMVDESEDWQAILDKHGKVDHWENLRQTAISLYRLLGKHIPSCIITAEEENSNKVNWSKLKH